jgi:4-hydroxy-tetrahydrodipicolinate synthase
VNATQRPRGVLAPVVTPFRADLRPDATRLVHHCRWLLEQDVGLAVFGTNSEANSLAVPEKLELLDALVEAGIPTGRMMPGTGCCAFPDTVELTRRAVQHGCAGVLMLPPFYYKGVSDDGLFASYAEVIERVADPRLRIYLYHIPPVSQVPITLALIERLLARYPDTVAGVKDSSGDWSNTRAMLERFAPRGFDVFSGSETYLLATLRGGGAGCISATANVNPAAIARLAGEWQRPDADARQAALDRVRTAFQNLPMIPALKAAIAHESDDDAWTTVRPPLVGLTAEQRAQLLHTLKSIGFAMPGLADAAHLDLPRRSPPRSTEPDRVLAPNDGAAARPARIDDAPI